MQSREAFEQTSADLLGTYCEDCLGSEEIVEACWHLVELFEQAAAYTTGQFDARCATQVFYLDLSNLDAEVVSHITGKTGNAPERYLGLAHVAVHFLVAGRLKHGVRVCVRLRGVPLSKLAGQLRAHDVSSVISVRGTVVRLSAVQPLASQVAFRCAKCGDLQASPTIDGVCTAPAQCPRGKCRGAKRFGASFLPDPLHPLTQTVNYQRLKLQVESNTKGRIPTSVEVELQGSLCDQASPGDMVTCTGILKQDTGGGRGGKKGGRDLSGLTAAYLQCNNVERFGPNGDAVKDSSVITEKNKAGIRWLSERPDVFSRLVHSLCPSIMGHDLVKAGMLLTLFGGTPRDPEGGQRGDTHMLVVGDPGAGKSQMLRAVAHVAPRSVLVSGNSASASGLTVTLVRDVTTGDSALEAGALVLGDLGVTCIDEFDKMEKTEHQSLLEAMEQQRISIAKAGAVGSLPARTSVLAAANPTSGHYDDLKSVAENLKLNPALLSRFDLVFILKDTIAGLQQEGLTRHVMSLHAGGGGGARGYPTHGEGAGRLLTLTHDSVESRLKAARYQKDELVPHELMTKYISHAKRTVRPRMSPEASEALLEYYLELRKASDAKDAMLITTRQLESLVRLAQARAKVDLRDLVTQSDARDVIDLMKRSLYQLCTDVGTGQIDANRGPGGAGRSKDGRALVNWMAEEASLSRAGADHIFSHKELLQQLVRWGYRDSKAEKTIQHLNTMGDILISGGGFRVKTTAVIPATPVQKGRVKDDR